MVRTAPDYRVRTFAQAFELLVGSPAQVRVAFDVLQVTLAHVLQAELGIVAVHDCHVVSLHIIQVTRHQHGECRFAGSSLLGGEGDEQGFFLHASLSFVRYTSVCFPGRRPCLRTGVSAWRQGCRPLRTPGCLHARQPVCTIAGVPVPRSACPCSRRYACVPAGILAVWRTMQRAGWWACRFSCPQRKGHFPVSVSLRVFVAAFGAGVEVCGFFRRFRGSVPHPNFAPTTAD